MATSTTRSAGADTSVRTGSLNDSVLSPVNRRQSANRIEFRLTSPGVAIITVLSTGRRNSSSPIRSRL